MNSRLFKMLVVAVSLQASSKVLSAAPAAPAANPAEVKAMLEIPAKIETRQWQGLMIQFNAPETEAAWKFALITQMEAQLKNKPAKTHFLSVLKVADVTNDNVDRLFAAKLAELRNSISSGFAANALVNTRNAVAYAANGTKNAAARFVATVKANPKKSAAVVVAVVGSVVAYKNRDALKAVAQVAGSKIASGASQAYAYAANKASDLSGKASNLKNAVASKIPSMETVKATANGVKASVASKMPSFSMPSVQIPSLNVKENAKAAWNKVASKFARS